MIDPRLLIALLLAGCTTAGNRTVVDQKPSAFIEGSSALVDAHYHAPFAHQGSAKLRDQVVSEMARDGVGVAVIGVTDYDEVPLYNGAFDDRFLTGVMLGCPRNNQAPEYWCFPSSSGWADLAWLERAIRAGEIEAIHEVLPNYNGIPVTDARYAPYFALAAKYDIPVGIHTGRGPGPANPPRSNPGCCPNYDSGAGNPAKLRPILDRHPNLRVWIQHVGAAAPTEPPFWEETLALLRDYPSVHLDMSITNSLMPAPMHEAALKRLVDAGLADRIMFGSDNMSVAESESRLNAIAWLTDAQRRAVRRENAIRFFGLGQR